MTYKTAYKVGDKIVMKSDALCIGECTLNGDRCVLNCLKGTDRVLTISEIGDDFFLTNGEVLDDSWYVSTCDILGYAFDYGEEIEVSDTGHEHDWNPHKFNSYSPENVYSIMTDQHSYRYARPITKPVRSYRVILALVEYAGHDEVRTHSEACIKTCYDLEHAASVIAGLKFK